ncbi:hypothetical protein TUM17384_14490 [Shewanella algae]|uniref:hypothetical protein n=1 Tax=Shewanella algae TaxID=38313 RepID=UPI001BED72DF|nr:hypothetical protein [Shewanella algae]BCV57504.1 hypothetical protein TUM17384_14490 [Shewanella algae]
MNKKKIVHFATDEKFIDMGMDSFKLSGYLNELYIFGNFERNYIKSKAGINVKLISALKGINIPDDCELIIIHSLNYLFIETLLKVKKSIPILWLGWGMIIMNK